MTANVTWTGQPKVCRCGTRRVVATLAETMDCPYAWLELPGGWVHTRWLRDPGGAR